MILTGPRQQWRRTRTAASRAGSRSKGVCMTASETQVLIGALVGLFGALQAWLSYKAVNHDQKLDGLMGPRIAAGAAAVVVADQQAQAALPAAASADARSAHIVALEAELVSLKG